MEPTKPVTKKSPAKKTAAKKASPKPEPTKQETKKEEPSTIAVFSEGKLFHPNLGRLTAGYNVLEPSVAQEWMKISSKVREASPQEVASAYGV
jgi:hypothetical protein